MQHQVRIPDARFWMKKKIKKSFVAVTWRPLPSIKKINGFERRRKLENRRSYHLTHCTAPWVIILFCYESYGLPAISSVILCGSQKWAGLLRYSWCAWSVFICQASRATTSWRQQAKHVHNHISITYPRFSHYSPSARNSLDYNSNTTREFSANISTAATRCRLGTIWISSSRTSDYMIADIFFR